MATNDQGFVLQSAGQADWDSALNANFNIAERGYHLSGVAGANIRTGDIVWVSSANFMYPFNPNSLDVRPHALAYYAVNSGEAIQVLLNGIVRSLSVHSAAIPGIDLFVSAATPGAVVASYSGASRRIGFGVAEVGLYFNPWPDPYPEKLTRSTTVADMVVNSNFLFSLDVGKGGINRRVRLFSDSANLVSLIFYSGSTRAGSERLFETISGGITTAGSWIDQAMWPYENTEVSTISGLIFGVAKINSGSAVTSAHLSVELIVERFR